MSFLGYALGVRNGQGLYSERQGTEKSCRHITWNNNIAIDKLILPVKINIFLAV
jgi:hypothetical protein